VEVVGVYFEREKTRCQSGCFLREMRDEGRDG
jgi:hypothetical protein